MERLSAPMFVTVIIAATLSMSGITGLGAAKSILHPPPSPWLGPPLAVTTVLTLVVALLIWGLQPAFTHARKAKDPKEQIALITEALEPILKVLKLMPSAPKEPKKDEAPKRDEEPTGHGD